MSNQADQQPWYTAFKEVCYGIAGLLLMILFVVAAFYALFVYPCLSQHIDIDCPSCSKSLYLWQDYHNKNYWHIRVKRPVTVTTYQ
jgi:hypothetical protein